MKLPKPLAAAILIVSIIVQLAVPLIFIMEEQAILNSGNTYYFEIENADAANSSKLELYYSDAFDYVAEEEYRYKIFVTDTNGICTCTGISNEKPTDGIFLKSASGRKYVPPISIYHSTDAKHVEDMIRQARNNGEHVLARAKVLNGRAVLTGIEFKDGTIL